MISSNTLQKFLQTLNYSWNGKVSLINSDYTSVLLFLPAEDYGMEKLTKDVFLYEVTNQYNETEYKMINLSHSDFIVYNFDVFSYQWSIIEGDYSEDWILFQARNSSEDLTELLTHFCSLNYESNAYYDEAERETIELIKGYEEQLKTIKKERIKTQKAYNNTIKVLKNAGYDVDENIIDEEENEN